MISTNNFKLLEINNIKNPGDLFYYLWIVLFIPVVNMLFFSVPFFLSFRVKKTIYFFVIIGVITFLEYLTYVYFTSQKHIDFRGVIIEIIGLILFYFLFFKKINKYINA